MVIKSAAFCYEFDYLPSPKWQLSLFPFRTGRALASPLLSRKTIRKQAQDENSVHKNVKLLFLGGKLYL
jgi:hypothetical protein